MEDRRDLRLDEQVFASAYKQAIMCYRILWFFNFAIEIEYFEKAQALRELKREAERLLVDQGLPSTLEEWGDPSGNQYRIEFDKKLLEATLKVDLHSFARRFSDLCSGYMEEKDEDE
jgi:CRISPR/Cas system-associated exonuclease Cas4 (RecB family)